jgi:CheY-like chemotaxis protein
MIAARPSQPPALRGSANEDPHDMSNTRLRSPLILLVDDSLDARLTTSEYLIDAGFVVESAADGNHAVMLALSLIPDLVLMDLVMPELDGWEAARLLRSYASTRRIPIVALSALRDGPSVARAMEAGFDRFLGKPFVAEELESLVRRTLREDEGKRAGLPTA